MKRENAESLAVEIQREMPGSTVRVGQDDEVSHRNFGYNVILDDRCIALRSDWLKIKDGGTKQILLRVTGTVFHRLKALAAAKGSSVNQEIVDAIDKNVR